MDQVILKNKPKLINWLKLDSIYILQYVQTKEIITTSEYDKLMSMTDPRDVVIKLLDIILGKGETACRVFLNLLKDDDVNAFSPQLREWIKAVDTSVQKKKSGQESAIMVRKSGSQVTSNISASNGSHVFSPTIAGSTLGSVQMNMHFAPSVPKPDRDWERREIQDYQKFLRANTSQLVQNVKNIDPIIDDLILGLHKESIANVRANSTRQQKMRELLDCVNCESIAKDLVEALFKHEAPLMKELQY